MTNSNSATSNKTFIFAISLKKNIISVLFVCFTLCLIFFSNSNLIAAKKGLNLWANNVIPALFPFFVATELLSYTNVCEKISKLLEKIMRPIFNIPGNGAYAFILGIISGYPVGAKIVTSLRNSNKCTRTEGNRMLAFTNNSGPLFVIGTIGVTLFKSTTIGILLLITHILSSITIGFLLGIISKFKYHIDTFPNFTNHNSLNYNTKYCNLSNLGEVLGNSIVSAIKNILVIGGFVVLFSVIISILNTSKIFFILEQTFKPIFKLLNIDYSFITPILTGLLELTNGVSLVSSVPCKALTINIVICAFLLGFGGLSVLLQVFSIISKSDLSIKTYFFSKLLQGIIAALYTYILISIFGFLNFCI